MRKSRIDELRFKEIKHSLKYKGIVRAVMENDVSLKTVLQVKFSKTFSEYVAQNKAQHPPLRYSLADDVLELHALTFRKNNDYIPPKSARIAVGDLLRYYK